MRDRQEIERLEMQNLAAYAMKSAQSGQRDVDEPAHPYRTCYQRDRDRVVHSQAFRKLEYKTQVFVIFEGDYYRTRLTHTIEVAQIGRTIGRALRLNEDLIEAISLAHDLGHPPFGHEGEAVLKEIMDVPDAGHRGFNHNFHSYEIVTQCEKRYPDFHGLNLTREVLVGILKHETDYDRAGYCERYDEGPTIEAQIVDFADSLAYVNHDVDDGLKSGCITVDDLMESELWRHTIDRLGAAVRLDDLEMLRYQVVKELIDVQVRDFLTHTYARLQDLKFSSAADVKRFREKVVGFSPEMCRQVQELKDMLMDKLYHHYRVRRMTNKARRIITDLFEVYLKDPHQLPPEVYPRVACSQQEKYHIICNHIAGMTDRSALEEHKRFFNAYTKV